LPDFCPIGGHAVERGPLSRVSVPSRSFCLSDSGRICAFGAAPVTAGAVSHAMLMLENLGSIYLPAPALASAGRRPLGKPNGGDRITLRESAGNTRGIF